MAPKLKTAVRKKRFFHWQTKYFFSNRKVKDRLFCFIFERDRKALLQLYNALNGTDYRDENALEIVTLKNVVYMSMQNDVAFILAGNLNLYEHQSTLCPNMPLRFLLYLAGEFEVIISRSDEKIYGSTLLKLPAPQCIVFYNGEANAPEEQFLHLTDAFADENGDLLPSCLELTVRVLNINHGHNQELMRCCGRLEEYSLFVAQMRYFQDQGCTMNQSIDLAVRYCIDHGIMRDILLPMRAEVKKMLLTEYNERKVMRYLKKEAREEGLAEGRTEGRAQGLAEGRESVIRAMLQNGISAEQIAQMTNLSLQEIAAVKDSVTCQK